MKTKQQDMDLATTMLGDRVAEYMTKNNVDRPTATTEVMKTERGRELYAKSVGRDTAPAPAVEETHAVTKSAREYESDLEALAKSKGMRLADVVKTPEGRELYNLSVTASRGGAR